MGRNCEYFHGMCNAEHGALAITMQNKTTFDFYKGRSLLMYPQTINACIIKIITIRYIIIWR